MDEVANAILDAGLDSALQVTLLELHRKAEAGLFVGTQQDIADARGVTRGTVSRQIKRLRELGWIEKLGSALRIVTDSTKRRESQQDVDSVNNLQGFPLSALPFSPKKVHSTPFEPSLLTPSQVSLEPPSASPSVWLRPSDEWDSLCEPLPEDHRARWDHLPGDWTYDFAAAALENLRGHDLLATPTQKKISRDGEEYVTAEWADTFRLLHEQDGYSKDEILNTMQWLFSGGNFWIQNEAIRSVPPLRSKTRDGDAYKFDIMYQQAHSTNEPGTDRDAKQSPEAAHQRIGGAIESAKSLE
jgi:hypothetical protein